VVLVEAKWRSPVGERQGVDGDQSQLDLRQAFCRGDGARLFPGATLAILGIGTAKDESFREAINRPEGSPLVRSLEWEQVVALHTGTLADELDRYLQWKRSLTRW
jgi:hypothetical protein